MQSEYTDESRSVDFVLGGGDNGKNPIESNIEDIMDLNEANNLLLDDIDEAEESEEESSSEENTSSENEETDECDDLNENIVKNSEIECVNIKNEITQPRQTEINLATCKESSSMVKSLQDEIIKSSFLPNLNVIQRPQEYVFLLGPESSMKTVQEPWPNDVKLYQPYEVEQILLPDNANCLAVQAYLRMCQLNYHIESRANAEAMSPTGKVPFIKCGAFVVSELEGIVQFVNNRGITLTEKLDDEEKSDMRAYMCLIHNVLEKAELYICWMDNETYNDVTSIRHGSVYPWPLNHIQNWTKRKTVMKNLKVWNWYDKKLEEVFQEVENACQALSDRLDNKEFFFGNRTELDALVFGHVYSLYTACFYTEEFRSILRKFQPLMRHCERIGTLIGRDADYEKMPLESGDQ